MFSSQTFRNVAISVFFIVLTVISWQLKVTIDEQIKHLGILVENTSYSLVSEVSGIRSDTFQRIDNIESKLFNNVGEIKDEIVVLREDLSQSTTNVNVVLANASETLKTSEMVLSNVNSTLENTKDYLNCDLNEYCWQNLSTDVLVDTRTMVRQSTDSFITAQLELPKITKNIEAVTSSVAVSSEVFADKFPDMVDNSTRTSKNVEDATANISIMTKPKWYHRVLSYGVSSSLFYFLQR